MADGFILSGRAVVRGVSSAGDAQVEDGAAVVVRDGTIAFIGAPQDAAAAHPDLVRIRRPDEIVVPGLVNAHHHFGLTPIMMGVPFAPLELWLPRFRGMRSVGARLDTLYSAIEMLETGTTAVQHIQSGLSGPEEAWDGIVDPVVEAYREIGMRVSWSFMLRDRNQLTYGDDDAFLATLPAEVADHFRPQIRAALAPVARHMAFFEAAAERWAARDPDGVRLQLAPANLHWCSDPTLQALFETAARTRSKVHMHLVETERQAAFARRHTGRSAVAHLARLGCLGPDLTLGHGIWLSEGDLDLVAEHGCQICHNASSGLRLGSGLAPVNAMRRRGIRVALGIDQSNIDDDRDLYAEMRLVFALHRPAALFDDPPSAAEVFRMASEHAADTTGFAGRIGRLDVGMAADIVTLHWPTIARPHVETRTPLLDAVVLRSRKDMVRSVWVGGREVVRDGRVTSLDRDAVLAEIAARLAEPPSAAETRAQAMVDRLMPHLEAWFRAYPDHGSPKAYRYNAIADG